MYGLSNGRIASGCGLQHGQRSQRQCPVAVLRSPWIIPASRSSFNTAEISAYIQEILHGGDVTAVFGGTGSESSHLIALILLQKIKGDDQPHERCKMKAAGLWNIRESHIGC